MEALKFGIPPGDPERLQDLANALAALAEVMDGVSAGYRAAGTASGDGLWEGLAGQAFRIRVGEMRGSVDIGREQFRNGAVALRSFADALQTAQNRIRVAQADADQAAEAGMWAKSQLDLLTIQGDLVSPARFRLLETVDRAVDDLRRAQTTANGASEDLDDAVRRFVGALSYAKDAAQAPPDAPEPGVTPTETVRQFLARQAGDIFIDPFGFSGKEVDEQGRLIFDLAAGTAIGHVEQFHTTAKDLWVITQPGTVKPQFVRGYYRRTPNGGRVWIEPYVRVIHTPPKVVDDLASRARSARIAGRTAPLIGGGIAGVLGALDQWLEDRDRPDLDGADMARRMAGAGAIAFVSSTVGSTLGGTVGRGIGEFIGGVGGAPGGFGGLGAGVAIGGIAGGVVGGIYGGGVGEAIGEKVEGRFIK